MCGCFDIFDFVCFFTFFVTAIVALLFVQCFFVYLDFETDEKTKTVQIWRCIYFLILTFLGCLVFAGVQRRSICLLKWPSRLLVALITVGLIFLNLFLWTLDRVQKQSVRDLELKTIKLSLVIVLVIWYLAGVQKLINLIQSESTTHLNDNLNFVHDNHVVHDPPSSNLVDAFRTEKLKKTGVSVSGPGGGGPGRPFNADKNGVNYYKLLLEGSHNLKRSSSSSSSKVGSVYSVSSFAGGEGVISQV